MLHRNISISRDKAPKGFQAGLIGEIQQFADTHECRHRRPVDDIENGFDRFLHIELKLHGDMRLFRSNNRTNILFSFSQSVNNK
jgi:hypothetical protein